MKKETLEEANETELYQTINKIIDGGKDLPKGFNVSRGQAIDYAFKIALEISKWQQERSYSEEEVLELLHKRMTYTLGEEYKEETTLEWLEHLKNKHEKQIKFLPVTDKIM